MDRRIQKTRTAIFNAFYKLIQKHDYSKISIQNIIDQANIGRSTFYEHFETKDELLHTMCLDMFNHIFQSRSTDENCIFSYSNVFSDKIKHILFHILEEKNTIKGILKSESRDIFLMYFRRYLENVLSNEEFYLKLLSDGIPNNFFLHHMVGTIVEAVLWWAQRNFADNYEDVSGYIVKVLNIT